MGIGRPAINIGPIHARRGSSRRVYRGSRKRLQRLKWYRQSSIEFWLFVAFMAFLLFFGVPWMITHPSADHRAVSNPLVSPNP
jgi:hypothetical protein